MASHTFTVNSIKRETTCVWWRLRTGLEKCLLFGWTSVSVVFFGLCIVIITLATLHNYSVKATVCVSNECLHQASRIMQYLNESVPPCTDFYRFACGKWLDSAFIPEYSNSISSFSVTQERINWKLRKLLEQPIQPIDSNTVKNLKNMYNSCMNSTLIHELGSKPLIKYLKLLGGWPVIDGQLWNETQFNLIDLMTKIRDFGFNNRFFLTVNVAPNYKRNTKFNIYIAQPVFTCLTNKELIDTNSAKLEVYLDFMVDVAIMLGADEERAERELKEVILLESMIANKTRSLDSFKFMTVKELEGTAPMEWTQLLNAMLSSNLKIDEKETLIIWSVQSVTDITRIINSYVHKNKRVLVNYIMWRIVFQSIKTLDKSFTELYDDFYLQTRPLKRNTKRWITCLKLTGSRMKMGLTSLYLINDDKKEKKRLLANKIFESIRSTLNKTLAQIDWLDDSTRLNAVHKIKSINKFIGYTDELINPKIIDQVYETMDDLKNDSLFENNLKIQKWSSDTEYSKLRTINDRNGWQNIDSNTEINAYYTPYINGIKIPVWILEGMFFGIDRPNYLNYGSLGWIIGHELIHPFDNIGSRFDNRGNLRDWWDVETKELFHNKSECFVKQYRDTFPNSIGERSRLSEDMADNGGIQMAFRTYQEYVKQNGKELPLPGLSYTSDQLFWISAAQIWCSKLSHMGNKYFAQTSIHSLSQQRVDISFSNSKEFSKIFNCSQTDDMNPEKKCKVW